MQPAAGCGTRLEGLGLKVLNRWTAGFAVVGFVLSWLFTHQTTYQWRDTPPAGSSLVQLEGSLNRTLFQVRGLSLQLRYADGHRLSWIGTPDFAPAGLVHSAQGAHLVLVEWGRPLGEAGRPLRAQVCWVRDPWPGATPMVAPLFVPQPLVRKLLPGQWRFEQVDPALVRDTPRLSAEELLRLHDAQPSRGACPNLYLADQA